MKKSSYQAAMAAATGLLLLLGKQKRKKQLQALKDANQKLSDNNLLLHHWLQAKNEGQSIEEYFLSSGYRRIAIYGMGDLANRLVEELADSKIQIDYGIDQDVSCAIARVKTIYSPQEELPDTDAVIVTPYDAFESIRVCLEEKVKCPILSIEEVVWSI